MVRGGDGHAGGNNADGKSLKYLGLVSYGRDAWFIPLLRQGRHSFTRTGAWANLKDDLASWSQQKFVRAISSAPR